MTPEHGAVNRGRVYDAPSGRWFKNGYAPFQLPEYLIADCGRCKGSRTLVIARGGAYCMACSPVVRA